MSKSHPVIHHVSIATCAGLVSLSLLADSREVGNVPDLVSALDALKGDRNNVVYLLPGNYDVKDCASGNGHLKVDQVTLEGKAEDPREVVIYDSTRSDRIIYCNKGIIKNLTVSNGCVAAGSGAGVLGTDHYYSKLADVVITCCEAPEGEGVGCRDLAEARNCQFIGNKGKYGGGAANVYWGDDRGAGVLGGEMRDNVVTVGGGGAMNCTVEGVVISNNVSGESGGGYYNNSKFWVKDCEIRSNTAGSWGGGVYLTGTTSYVTNTTVAGNSAYYSGGGVFAPTGRPVVGCVITNNTCDGKYESNAFGFGGGAGIAGAQVVNCIVIGNAITNGANWSSSSNFGGAGLLGCPFVTNTVVAGNVSANNGGGAHNSTLVGCVISNNAAQCYGAGVCRSAVTDSKLVFNAIKNENGSQYFARGAGASLSFVTNSLVAGNAAIPTARVTEPVGGAGSETVFGKCVIEDNYAVYAAAMDDGSAYGCTFRNNATSRGSQIFRNAKNLVECDIRGALFVNLANAVNCRIHDFTYQGYATIGEGRNVYTSGTFDCQDSGSVLFGIWGSATIPVALTNVLVYGNQAYMYFYGKKGYKLSVVNCEFVTNKVDYLYTALGTGDGGEAEVVNSIFVENLLANGSSRSDYRLEWGGDTNVVMRNCIFGTVVTAKLPRVVENTQFNQTVRFMTPADPEWPYQPKRQSSVLRKGLVQDWMAEATDVRGDPGYARLRDGFVDIGCYQNWQPVPGMLMLFR